MIKISTSRLRQVFKNELRYFDKKVSEFDYLMFNYECDSSPICTCGEYRIDNNSSSEEIAAIIKYLEEIDVQNIDINTIYCDKPFTTNGKFAVNSILLELFLRKEYAQLDLSKVKSYSLISDFSEINEDEKLYKIKFQDKADFYNNIENYGADGARFIIDFNRQLRVEDARKVLGKLSLNHIKYIEEPCQSFEQSLSLKNEYDFALAIDESIYSNGVTEGIDYVILKPAVFSDFAKNKEIIDWAKRNNKPIIISSAYQTAFGLDLLKKYVLYYELESELMGLDTAKLIKSENILQ